MNKIDKLTPEQEARMAEYVEQGIALGLCCDPIDEDAARDYGGRLMKFLGREYAGTVIVDSPLAANEAVKVLAWLESSSGEDLSNKVNEALMRAYLWAWYALAGSLDSVTMARLDRLTPRDAWQGFSRVQDVVHGARDAVHAQLEEGGDAGPSGGKSGKAAGKAASQAWLDVWDALAGALDPLLETMVDAGVSAAGAGSGAGAMVKRQLEDYAAGRPSERDRTPGGLEAAGGELREAMRRPLRSVSADLTEKVSHPMDNVERSGVPADDLRRLWREMMLTAGFRVWEMVEKVSGQLKDDAAGRPSERDRPPGKPEGEGVGLLAAVEELLAAAGFRLDEQVLDPVTVAEVERVSTGVRLRLWREVKRAVESRTEALSGMVANQARAGANTDLRRVAHGKASKLLHREVWMRVWDKFKEQTGSMYAVRNRMAEAVRTRVLEALEPVRDELEAAVDRPSDRDRLSRRQVSSSVRGRVEHVHVRAMSQVGDSLYDAALHNVIRLVTEAVAMNVMDLIREQVDRASPGMAVWPYLDGQFWAHIVTWHRYFTEVVGLELPSIWQYEEQTKFGPVYPLSKYVIISRRPERIRTDSAGRLHCDGGPAVRYADGFSVYALNGVRVPEWLAVTPEGEIDPAEFAKIENAEVRREFVRKVGIERIAAKTGAVTLDAYGDYELLSVNLGGSTGECSCLKMVNPSTGTYHMEFVPPEIDTVEKALRWRNQSDLEPSQLT